MGTMLHSALVRPNRNTAKKKKKLLQQITSTPDVVCQNPRVPFPKKNRVYFGLGLAPIMLYSLAYPSILYTVGFHACWVWKSGGQLQRSQGKWPCCERRRRFHHVWIKKQSPFKDSSSRFVCCMHKQVVHCYSQYFSAHFGFFYKKLLLTWDTSSSSVLCTNAKKMACCLQPLYLMDHPSKQIHVGESLPWSCKGWMENLLVSTGRKYSLF